MAANCNQACNPGTTSWCRDIIMMNSKSVDLLPRRTYMRCWAAESLSLGYIWRWECTRLFLSTGRMLWRMILNILRSIPNGQKRRLRAKNMSVTPRNLSIVIKQRNKSWYSKFLLRQRTTRGWVICLQLHLLRVYNPKSKELSQLRRQEDHLGKKSQHLGDMTSSKQKQSLVYMRSSPSKRSHRVTSCH